MSKQVRVCICLSKEMHELVKKLAESEHRSVSNYISHLILKESNGD